MLITLDRTKGLYIIAITNSTGWAELAADFRYLAEVPPGEVLFDFTHLSGNLTFEKRFDYLPGSFGFHPTDRLAEEVTCIDYFREQQILCPHQLRARLPHRSTKVGAFLFSMRVGQVLRQMGLEVIDNKVPENGHDDLSRKNLIPLTYIVLHGGQPDFTQLRHLRQCIEQTFSLSLSQHKGLANRFTSVVNEAVDNLLQYGHGGLIAGLYYPQIGEVEISLINRRGGFGGQTPQEQLEQLFSVVEGATERTQGGGRGIRELMDLAYQHLGTLRLSNGNASLYISADGNMTSVVDDTGIDIPGGRVTIVLQLLPAAPLPSPTAQAMVDIVRRSIFRSQEAERMDII